MIEKDLAKKKMTVTREYTAPLGKVWKAWTEAELLDKWWAPKPYRAETRQLDFRPGGLWIYAMVSPEDQKTLCRVAFTDVTGTSFSTTVNFCDEDGNVDPSFPSMRWTVSFTEIPKGTKIVAVISFDAEADMEKIVAMGFEEGFTMGLGNLDRLLAPAADPNK